MPPLGRRICVVGNAGAGKTTVARALARRWGLRCIDRDALVWREGWAALPREQRAAAFETATRVEGAGGWTYDGHLRAARPEEQVVLERCDTIVWLDLPRWQVMRSVLARSLRRAVTRERLAHGNVEGWRMLFSREFSVAWAWRHHDELRGEYERLVAQPGARAIVRLRSRAEVDRWLASLEAG